MDSNLQTLLRLVNNEYGALYGQMVRLGILTDAVQRVAEGADAGEVLKDVLKELRAELIEDEEKA